MLWKTAAVFMEFGMGCLGCAAAHFENIEQGAIGHGINVPALQTSDLQVYEDNMHILYDALTEMGFSCVKPDGTFYMFPKSLEPDAVAFCNKAKEFDLLLVPGDGFSCPGRAKRW